jgi:DNA-binding HxlR family transcriptional regulator
MNCSIAQSLEIIGEWWTLLILRDSFLGVRRFEDFVERLGISRNILTTRLDTLVSHGVLERRTYDVGRERHDYVLTDKGLALWPVLTTLREWGDEWVVGQDNVPITLEHKARGHRAVLRHVCDECGEPLDARAVRAVPGPGTESQTDAIIPSVEARSAKEV